MESPTAVSPQRLEEVRQQFIKEVAALPDLLPDEQNIVVDMCVAFHKNNGWGPAPAGVTGLANLVRSGRAARQAQINFVLKGAQ